MITPPILTAHHPSGNPALSWFTLHCVESDSSRLSYDPRHGTCLDKSLPREFELRIYERDASGYCGLCAQFELARLDDALRSLLSLSDFTPMAIQNGAALQTK